jgi:hypothetical protein
VSYDADDDRVVVAFVRPMSARVVSDHEVLVTLLELAALELTPTAGATFTRAQLFDRAREIGTPDSVLASDATLAKVLATTQFLRRGKDGALCLR